MGSYFQKLVWFGSDVLFSQVFVLSTSTLCTFVKQNPIEKLGSHMTLLPNHSSVLTILVQKVSDHVKSIAW